MYIEYIPEYVKNKQGQILKKKLKKTTSHRVRVSAASQQKVNAV